SGTSFNGAALFRARKVGFKRLAVHLRQASMGPRSFERGRSSPRAGTAARIEQLQWGRALSSAEGTAALASRIPSAALQWGRALSSAEGSRRADGSISPSVALQW